MMILKYKNYLFGDIETFEGDPFYWMIDWGTLAFRNRFNVILSAIMFFGINVAFVVMIRYFCIATLTLPELEITLLSLSVVLYVMSSYVAFLGQIDGIKNGLEQLKQLRIPYNTIQSSLKNKINKLSTFIGNTTFYSCLFLYVVFVLYLFFADKKKDIVFVLIRDVLKDNLMVKCGFLGLCMNHGLYFSLTPMLITFYFMLQFECYMKILNYELNNFVNNDGIEKIFDGRYQTELYEKLTKFLFQVASLRKTFLSVNEFLKYRLIFVLFPTVAVLSTNLVLLMKMKELNSMDIMHLVIFLTTIRMNILISERGHAIVKEGEDIYLKVLNFNWYNWNVANRKLLIMLLLETKKPLCLTVFGFSEIDRPYLLKMYQLIHTYITFSRSVKSE